MYRTLLRPESVRIREKMDFGRKKLRLGDVLVNSKAITNTQLLQALDLQKGSGKKLGEVLV